jgi:hypothetical protein
MQRRLNRQRDDYERRFRDLIAALTLGARSMQPCCG